jgi:uncharacterized integral membrane protein
MSAPAAPAPASGTRAGRIKLGLLGLLAVLLLVFMLTNWDPATLRFPGLGTLALPLSVLLFLAGGSGFALGWAAKAWRARRAPRP